MKKTLLILLSILVVLFAFVACEESVDYVLDNEPAPGPGPGPGPEPSPVHVTSVSLDKTELILDEGDDETLTATVLPSDATNKKVTWTSNKPAVATVDANGKVTGVAAGTATITVTTEDGEKTATCAVTVKADAKTIPLTLEFPTAGTGGDVTVTIHTDSSKTVGPVTYSINGGAINTFTSGTPVHVDAGGKISIYRTLGENLDFNNYFTISCNAICYVYGNVMSVYSATGFESLLEIEYTYAFYKLFSMNTNIMNHPTIALVLPATTLAANCYTIMFEMCNKLTTAPELPAPTLVSGCYEGMFSDCANLKSITCLATGTPAPSCTNVWLNAVASTGTFITPAGTTWETDSSSGIPYGWTRQDYPTT